MLRRWNSEGRLAFRPDPAILQPAGAGQKAGARRPDALICLAVMLSMPEGSWLRLGLWLLCSLVVYFVYAWRAGRLGENEME